MEYCTGGSINKFLQDQKKSKMFPVKEEILKKYLFQSLSGLEYLHSKGIIHRDIKPQNLFLDDFKNLKIGDFGIAKRIESAKGYAKSMCGTALYMAAELATGKYTNLVDIYSLGVTFLKFMLNEEDFAEFIAEKDFSIIRNKVNRAYSESVLQIMESMLATAKKRKAAKELIDLPYFQNFQNFQVQKKIYVCFILKLI
jgi:serine/threonine protein kinase